MGELAQAAGKLEQQELEVELELPRGAARVPCLVTVSPGAQPRVGAVLMHGAGGNLHSGHLPRFAAALAAAGAVCVRFTARAPNLAYRARVCEALLEQLPQRSPACAAVRRWLVCGHSLGARVAVQVAHDLPHLALACVLLSFPLHPPGKPQQVRDDPLTQLRLPVLAVRGTGDEFSGALEWAGVLERMQTRQLEVGGAGWVRLVLQLPLQATPLGACRGPARCPSRASPRARTPLLRAPARPLATCLLAGAQR